MPPSSRAFPRYIKDDDSIKIATLAHCSRDEVEPMQENHGEGLEEADAVEESGDAHKEADSRFLTFPSAIQQSQQRQQALNLANSDAGMSQKTRKRRDFGTGLPMNR
ncbi:hypothetical protein Cni_G11984 [Canna indica]|uniref:Uncharacterized protein n=1 Tax=Canna indica TaxID=4628 RepID=A0AAQ3K7L6_9LILI|nr:hypothetical protein Cni_G11984 [Canna indica]